MKTEWVQSRVTEEDTALWHVENHSKPIGRSDM
jgi:hypothetical protein